MLYHHLSFFFVTDTATPRISTLSLHDALPISNTITITLDSGQQVRCAAGTRVRDLLPERRSADGRSEEHTSELQSRGHLVCRLLLEKKKNLRQHLMLQVDTQLFLVYHLALPSV